MRLGWEALVCPSPRLGHRGPRPAPPPVPISSHLAVLLSLCPGVSFWLRAICPHSLIPADLWRKRLAGCGGPFHPCPLTGVLAPHVSSFCCSILLRRSPPWWVSLPLSCGLARALCLGPEPCWYWNQPAPWWEKLPMSAQLYCDLPAP